jgi:hypothetical protein
MYIVFSIPCFGLNSVFRFEVFSISRLSGALVSKWSSSSCYKGRVGCSTCASYERLIAPWTHRQEFLLRRHYWKIIHLFCVCRCRALTSSIDKRRLIFPSLIQSSTIGSSLWLFSRAGRNIRSQCTTAALSIPQNSSKCDLVFTCFVADAKP